jgi:hypothetical protein
MRLPGIGEMEATGLERNWGAGLSASTWFVRPIPMADLRASMMVVLQDHRLGVVEGMHFKLLGRMSLVPSAASRSCVTAALT